MMYEVWKLPPEIYSRQIAADTNTNISCESWLFIPQLIDIQLRPCLILPFPGIHVKRQNASIILERWRKKIREDSIVFIFHNGYILYGNQKSSVMKLTSNNVLYKMSRKSMRMIQFTEFSYVIKIHDSFVRTFLLISDEATFCSNETVDILE